MPASGAHGKQGNAAVNRTPDIIYGKLEEAETLRKSVQEEDSYAGIPEDVDIDELLTISICACRKQVEAMRRAGTLPEGY